MWYFTRIALLATPWKQRGKRFKKGILFKEYYIIEAASIEEALRKANHILSLQESVDGNGILNGEKVSYEKVGVLDLEPITSELVSGADIFDESETVSSLQYVRSLVMSEKTKARRIRYEKKHGMPPILPVFLGDGFDSKRRKKRR